MFRVVFVTLACAVFSAEAMYFAVMGDWGGAPLPPYTTGAEVNVAHAMDEAVAANDMKFALALGDNFYDEGVKNEFDPRFEETFENVFTGSHLQSPFEFKVLAGNHDHRTNVTGEVAYSAHSKRWTFPNLWYSFTETASDGATVEIVMIDTVVLAGQSQDDEGNDMHGNQLPGPADEEAAEDQWTFIESTLSASKADYVIVAGHYPIYSVCEHGPTSILVDRLLPMMEKYSASAYFAGHDHCAETLTTGSGPVHFGFGASHGLDNSLAHSSAVPQGSLKFHYGQEGEFFDSSHGAFGTVEITASGMTARHLKDDGSVLYTSPPIAPRKMA